MGEFDLSEKVVVGDSMPPGRGEDFQPKKDENLDCGEFFLLIGDVDCVEPNELSETDLGKPSCNTTMSGVCRSRRGLGIGERLLALEVEEVSDATRIKGGRRPRSSSTFESACLSWFNGSGILFERLIEGWMSRERC